MYNIIDVQNKYMIIIIIIKAIKNLNKKYNEY